MWNYRVFKSKDPECDEEYYTLIECFYDKNKKPWAYSEEAKPFGNTKKELIQVLEMMLKDAKKKAPVLTEEDFNKADPDYDLDDGQLTEEQYKLIQEESKETKYSHDEMVARMLQDPKVLEEYNKIKDD